MFISAFIISEDAVSQSNFINKESSYKFENTNLLNDSITNKVKKDTLKKKEVEFTMHKKPWKAAVLSAVLPGLGQFYNESYWKIPLIALVGGFLGYNIISNNSSYIDYRDLYIQSQTPGNTNGNQRYKELREKYRDQRDQSLLYFVLFDLITVADAFVDAHLYDFDVSDKIKLGFFQKGNFANLKISF